MLNWYSWLQRAGIEPPFTSEYALLFSDNELQEEDIVEFSHDFLQSIGISNAKHRLKIIRLARKEKELITVSNTMSFFLAVVKLMRGKIGQKLKLGVRGPSPAMISAWRAVKKSTMVKLGKVKPDEKVIGDNFRWDSMFDKLEPT
ncbi:hypothetical protein ZOSMA_181G00240 [Zostera marina]|uniref:SAM domain-containing protein n=1 Tax=Zostera marina TaxID=29655 RepID=A0A0K9PQZ6_ZOSMR|nr:hypothetical protein ZOSMA_181G00240 [Zostera marina]